MFITKLVQFLKMLMAIIPAVVAVAEAAFPDPGSGAKKRAYAVEAVKKALDDNGIAVPAFIRPIEDWAIGFLIDALVAALNKSGDDFFKPAAARSVG